MKTTLKITGIGLFGMTSVASFALAAFYACTTYDVLGVWVLVTAGIGGLKIAGELLG